MTKEKFWEGYTPAERKRFTFHMVIAVLCLPLYYLFPFHFGLLTGPYLFFLAVRPKSEYLLPIILQNLYGSQQKFFLCLGCFLYVLFHFAQLRAYSLHWLYLFYMLLLPYFIWFFFQKLSMPRYVPGVGALIGGLFSHFVFSVAFWAALVVKKTGRPFFRGTVVWTFVLLVLMSFIGGGADLDVKGTGEGLSHTVFSRSIFWAMPFLAATLTFCCLMPGKDFKVEKWLSLFGCVVLVLDFFHLLKSNMTFTLFGLCVFSSFLVFAVVKMKASKALRIGIPLLFVVSTVFVLLSPTLVAEYKGINAGEGDYNEMSMTSLDSILKKLQRKSVDDRASVWALTIKYIKRDILPNPIWVKPVPYMEVDVEGEDRGLTYRAQIEMASHNVMLNLIRNFGFYGGLGLYLLYLWYFCRKKNVLLMRHPPSSPLIVVMAVCLAEGVVGGHTGHYPVEPTFGVLLFSVLGACWGVQQTQLMKERMQSLRTSLNAAHSACFYP